jgi:hypothetical protein
MDSRIKNREDHYLMRNFSRLPQETTEERLDEMLENVSLKNVPLEERRKEAQKPLFLTRYE